MSIRLCLPLLLLIVGILAPLQGQDMPVKMTPDFALTFPLAQNGKDVTVKFPILINPSTVLKPGMVLRTLYIINYNSNSDGTSDLALAHKGNMEQSFSRSTMNADEQSKMPSELSHELEGYRRTIWQVPNNFVLAMAQYPTDIMHLIYSPTGTNRDLTDARFNFFDGLLVGLPGGKVTVVAVEDDSKAHSAGIKAGDEILSVGGISTANNLATFAAAYASAKKIATDNEVASYPLTIRSPGAAAPRPVNIAMPPSLKGGLMQGF